MTLGKDAAFRHAGFFLLRTPLLPVAAFERWSSGLAATRTGPDGAPPPEALAGDRALLRARLQEIVEEPTVAEGLFIASPSLSGSLRYWREDPDSKRGRRVERSLVSYFGRMCMRATPFGCFSGCAMGTIEGEGTLVLQSRARHRRVTRIDKPYLFAVCEDLRGDRSLREHLAYRPNGSLYRRGASYRYAQPVVETARLTHRLVAVEHSDALEVVLASAAQGATPAELAAAVVASRPPGEIDLEEARAFVEQLIDVHALVSALTPTVTGDEPADEILAQLERLAAHEKVAGLVSLLRTVQGRLSAMDEEGLGLPPSRYLEVFPSESELEQLLPLDLLKSWPEERLFQVDMLTADAMVTLSPSLAARLLDGAQLLHRLRGGTRHRELQRFRDAFVERFQDREVPLLEALDEEAGIGFARSSSPMNEASPLLEGIAFPPEKPPAEVAWGERERHLHRLLCAALLAGGREIALKPADVEQLTAESALPLPDAFSVAASVVGSSEELRDGEPRLYVKWVDGPPGARTLGRFCHVHARLRDAVVGYLADEEAARPQVLFAEIVHLPQGRAANVVCRPVLRQLELTFLGRSGAPEERQIPAADLMVSVVDGRVRLRSRRHDREVVPRLTCAHNAETNGLGLYKFLLALQKQGCSGGVAWSWGPLEESPFLPRVSCGKVILALAQWRLVKEQVAPLAAMTPVDRFAAVQRLRHELGLPRVAAVAVGDEFVPIDFDNALCVETFVQIAGDVESTAVRELLAAPDELCVESPEGLLAHELIVPFVRERRDAAMAVAPPLPAAGERARVPEVQRSFAPGSSWLYAKLYCDPIAAERLLLALVAPLVELGAADRWFFVRYDDPEFHLRVRFRGAPDRLHDELLPALERGAGELLTSGDLWRLVLDTYEREVERYGGPQGIELAEELFWIDSEAVLGAAAMLAADTSGETRWLLAARSADMLLDDLGFDAAGKLAVCRQLRDGYFAEFHGDDRLRQSLGRRFRAARKALGAVLDGRLGDGDGAEQALTLLDRRAQRAAPVAAQLRRRSGEGKLMASLAELAMSFLHMNAKRFFSNAPRAHEMVIYDFLHRVYESRLARGGASGETAVEAPHR